MDWKTALNDLDDPGFHEAVEALRDASRSIVWKVIGPKGVAAISVPVESVDRQPYQWLNREG